MIHDFHTFLNERKQRGLLYHYTSLSGLVGILKSNSLKPSDRKAGGLTTGPTGISLTRDRNFHLYDRIGIATQARLLLDGDKLTDNYKIRPYTDFKNAKSNIADLGKDELDTVESEEATSRPITNLRRYLIRVDLIPQNIDDRAFDNLTREHSDFVWEKGVNPYVLKGAVTPDAIEDFRVKIAREFDITIGLLPAFTQPPAMGTPQPPTDTTWVLDWLDELGL